MISDKALARFIARLPGGFVPRDGVEVPTGAGPGPQLKSEVVATWQHGARIDPDTGRIIDRSDPMGKYDPSRNWVGDGSLPLSLEGRVAALEARVAELEAGNGAA